MKRILIFTLLLIGKTGFTQSNFPDFLQGTWKMENKEVYEHWDRLNDHTLKGFSYKLTSGQWVVTEYLDLMRKDGEILYTATVINQNQGKGIVFKHSGTGDNFVFENPQHDFPKKIVYHKRSDTEIEVEVSDGGQRAFAYKLIRETSDGAGDTTQSDNPDYDPVLAQKLGGDDFGMKKYVFVILKTGSNTTAEQEQINKAFAGHMENINRLVEAGTLIVAGPLVKNDKNYRGIFILNNIPTLEEAEAVLQTDPAVKEGLLDVELFEWYGSAALPEYLPFSDKVWKVKH